MPKIVKNLRLHRIDEDSLKRPHEPLFETEPEPIAGFGQSQEFSLPIEIPVERLAPETLRSVLESFILREGTDYGTYESTLEEKVRSLSLKILNHSAHLVFDPLTETVTFVTDVEFRKIFGS